MAINGGKAMAMIEGDQKPILGLTPCGMNYSTGRGQDGGTPRSGDI